MRRIVRTFGHALRGVGFLVRTQRNARLHAAITAGVLLLGVLLAIDAMEWLALVLALALVWTAEAVNTALERLGDAVTREADPRIRDAKDLGAAAVFIAAFGAAVVGALVFVPKLARLVVST